MDKQAIYSKVRNHLLTQNEKSEELGSCLYRSTNEEGKPLMCAIGCLIPDNLYTEQMEGHGIPSESFIEDIFSEASPVSEVQQWVKLLRINEESDWELLRDLQYIHDNYEPDTWERSLDKLAKELDLDPK
jgi:hypothetical protein